MNLKSIILMPLSATSCKTSLGVFAIQVSFSQTRMLNAAAQKLLALPSTIAHDMDEIAGSTRWTESGDTICGPLDRCQPAEESVLRLRQDAVARSHARGRKGAFQRRKQGGALSSVL